MGSAMSVYVVLSAVGVVLAVFVATIGFLWYRSRLKPKPRETILDISDELYTSSRFSLVYTVAILVPDDSDRSREIVDGIVETLTKDARVKVEPTVIQMGASPLLYQDRMRAVVRARYDILVTLGTNLTLYAKEFTEKQEFFTPIVFLETADPVRIGLMDTPRCSGNHTTGVALLQLDWVDLMFASLMLIIPRASRIVVPHDPQKGGEMCRRAIARFRSLTNQRGIQFEEVIIKKRRDILNDIGYYCMEAGAILLIFPDNHVEHEIDLLSQIAVRYTTPLITALNPSSIYHGASLSFGYWPYDLGIAGGRQVLRILETSKLPSMVPLDDLKSSFRFLCNHAAALRQGLHRRGSPEILFLMRYGDIVHTGEKHDSSC